MSLGGATVAAVAVPGRQPSREENDLKVQQMRLRLAELRQEQEKLEREKASLEEMRRKQAEFSTGREEMVQHLTRGVGLLEEAVFDARRQAEQMDKTLGDLKSALEKVQGLREESWDPEQYQVELTRALTTIENARMEWNSARMKFDLLSPEKAVESSAAAAPARLLETMSFGQLCRLGLALTWPLMAALLVLGLLFFLGR